MSDSSELTESDSYESVDINYASGPVQTGTIGRPKGGTQVVSNQPFDEAVELTDSESVSSAEEASPGMGLEESNRDPRMDHNRTQRGEDFPSVEDVDRNVDDSESSEEEEEDPAELASGGDNMLYTMHPQDGRGMTHEVENSDSESESSGSEDDSSSSESVEHATITEGGYNPTEYAHLQVSGEIKELFQYISRYKSQPIELQSPFKPFIPDFIPAVGEIDPFIKIPRPDGRPDDLGLTVLDEPAAVQSDPTVMEMQLRMLSRVSNLPSAHVKSLPNAASNSKAITQWVSSLTELHRGKPPAVVTYAKNMPDIESLMQLWPAEFEETLNTVQLPSADLDVDLNTYARWICTLMDIPVYDSTVESLHVLFTLFSEFKTNQHFANQEEAYDMNAMNSGYDDGVMRMDNAGADVMSFE